MAAFAQIAVNDGESTPVSHPFDPKVILGDVAHFENRASGIALAYERMSIGVQRPSKNSRLYKVRLRMALPIMEVVTASTYNGITPAPTKAYEVGVDCVFFFPERSTKQQRKNTRVLFANTVNGVGQAIAAIEDLANIW